jgi:uncharacterized protein (DUF433 family)
VDAEVLALDEALQNRIVAKPEICGGVPCIKGTRIYVAVVLDALAEGLSTDEVLEHFPSLSKDDIRAAIAYAAELARENIWKSSA